MCAHICIIDFYCHLLHRDQRFFETSYNVVIGGLRNKKCLLCNTLIETKQFGDHDHLPLCGDYSFLKTKTLSMQNTIPFPSLPSAQLSVYYTVYTQEKLFIVNTWVI